MHGHLLQGHFCLELVLTLLIISLSLFVVVVYLRILKLVLRDEAVRDIRGDQVHVLEVVIYYVNIGGAQWVPHAVEWLLAWDVDGWDL